ncbi:flagellar hook-length control protein FliK [Pseudomonas sp. LS44]|uniref:flagellar hook-length control protein FliK n=1 Tax=Pseudomonas sp. LS44 TaxID=1357074 RepID=UPI00215AD3EB|nr:flagellar hook-length control protein FliK [Pseudomonas sp. LS44]UVE16368.1 flagellar hook-length control protein FliK [Pseudomonas sp. LS44]
MAVATDLLLKSAPEVKPRAHTTKAPDNSAEPRKNEASSFAQVYAKERQAKAAERNDEAAKAKSEKAKAANEARDGGDDPVAVVAGAESVVADSGKPLPTDPVAVDPSPLPGLIGQPPAADSAPEVVVDAEQAAALMLPATLNLTASGPASMTEASHDPQIDALNEVAAVNLVLGLDGKAQSAGQSSTQTGNSPAIANSVQGFAAAIAAFSDASALKEEGQLETELPLDELAGDSLETLSDSPSDLRSDNFASKLNALSQSIQQNSPSQRAALVPGQPVAMQQGNWSEAVVDRVMWLSSQNLKSAEIQLNPAELGRLEVRIDISKDDQTQVTFASPHAGVRDALEGQMHKLREMFTQQGMNTLDVSVSDQSLNRGGQGQGGDSERGASQFRGGHNLRGGEEEISLGMSEIRSTSGSGGRSLVDYYA